MTKCGKCGGENLSNGQGFFKCLKCLATFSIKCDRMYMHLGDLKVSDTHFSVKNDNKSPLISDKK